MFRVSMKISIENGKLRTLTKILFLIFFGFIVGRLYENCRTNRSNIHLSSMMNNNDISVSSIKFSNKLDKNPSNNIDYIELTGDTIDYNRVWLQTVVNRNAFAEYLVDLIDWQRQLSSKEQQIYSQNGEDGITLAIFDRFGSTNRFYVEFGVENGIQCNTRVLRENGSWRGIIFDAKNIDESIGLHRETITLTNVISIFEKYHIPRQFDLLSVDVDFGDFWVMHKILNAGYRPRVIIVELNANFNAFTSVTVPHRFAGADERWHGDKWFGASLLAWSKLLSSVYNYQLIYAEVKSVNAFFIRSDIVNNVDLALVAWTDRVESKLRYSKTNGIHRIPTDADLKPFSHICVNNYPCTSMDLF